MSKKLNYIVGAAGVIGLFYLGRKILFTPNKQAVQIKDNKGNSSTVMGAVQSDYKTESFVFATVDTPNIYYAETKENGEYRVGSKVSMANMRLNAGDRLGMYYTEPINPQGILGAYNPVVMNISGQPTLVFVSKSQSRI